MRDLTIYQCQEIVDAIQVPPLANIDLCGQQECKMFDGAAFLLAMTGLHLQTVAFPSQNVLTREVIT